MPLSNATVAKASDAVTPAATPALYSSGATGCEGCLGSADITACCRMARGCSVPKLLDDSGALASESSIETMKGFITLPASWTGNASILLSIPFNVASVASSTAAIHRPAAPPNFRSFWVILNWKGSISYLTLNCSGSRRSSFLIAGSEGLPLICNTIVYSVLYVQCR